MSHCPPLAVVCALIERAGKVLVAQRSAGQSQAGKWEFPGGKLEAGEALEAALIREIREELQLEITLGTRLPEARFDYGDVVITLLPFLAVMRGAGEPHAVEHAAVRWCRPCELAGLEWAPADLPVVAHYLARRNDRSDTQV